MNFKQDIQAEELVLKVTGEQIPETFKDAWPLKNWELKTVSYSILQTKSPAKHVLLFSNVLFSEVPSNEEALWKDSGVLGKDGIPTQFLHG